MVSFNEEDEVVCKVGDFGESLLVATQASGREKLANPSWCAPEIMNKEPYTEKADIFSMGIVFNELYSRERPYHEHEISQSRFISNFEDAIIKGLRPTIPPDTPPEMGEVIQTCWQADPSKRPTSDSVYKSLLSIAKKLTPKILKSRRKLPSIPVKSNTKTQEKVKVLSHFTISTITNVIIPHLKNWEKQINSYNVEEAAAVSQIIYGSRKDWANLRGQIQVAGFLLPTSSDSNFVADNLSSMHHFLSSNVIEMISISDGITTILSSPNLKPEMIIPVAQAVKSIVGKYGLSLKKV